MATEHKKEKRKLKKQQKRQKRILEIEKKHETEKLDVLHILKTELFDTKPNMAKLLDSYVKSIRLFISNNIDAYPIFHYDISRVFVKFNDESELIRVNTNDGFDYLIIVNFEERQLNEKEKELVSKFFSLLSQFKFIS